MTISFDSDDDFNEFLYNKIDKYLKKKKRQNVSIEKFAKLLKNNGITVDLCIV